MGIWSTAYPGCESLVTPFFGSICIFPHGLLTPIRSGGLFALGLIVSSQSSSQDILVIRFYE
jgi:hypothetical protein